jgi:tetratricopeptide (TPR) repeat protein
MKLVNMTSTGLWLRAAALSLPLVVAQVGVEKLAGTAGFQIGTAVAQEQKKDERETRRTPALRNKVYEKLAEAQTAAEAKDWVTARAVLDAMIDADGKRALNSYELANVYNLYAFINYSNEDFPGALEAYRNVIAQPDIPLAMEINTKYTIAQLYFVQEDWRQGVDMLLEWFAVSDQPSATAHVLLSQGYYQLKDYDNALEQVNIAITMEEGKGKLPKEQWYNLARFLYFERNDIDNTVATLENLVKYYPKDQYWIQLSHMYGEQKKEGWQLAAMETAYMQDMLAKGPERVTMAYLFLQGEVPYKAAQVMDKGLKEKLIDPTSKNYEIMGSAYRQAQEVAKAIPAMEVAASKSEDGELFARLGNVYLDGDRFEEAIEALEKGLKRGGLRRPDNARLSLGMAYFNTKQYDKARKAFRDAGKDERSETYARQWIKYLDSELERQAKLAED